MPKEFRPVFVEEMNLLGFDRFWRYDPDYRGIYMLAEKNCYWYGGTKIALVRGGRIGVDPVLHPLWLPGAKITPIEELPPPKKGHDLDTLESKVLERTEEVLRTTPHDIAYMGFSGGKDSLAMVHLLGRHFPQIVVSFGDTGMEFPQTHKVAEWMEKWCAERGLAYWTARPALPIEEAWRLFGPPSSHIRWCCSVCKSAPQQKAVRNFFGRADARTIAMTGVRASESARRAKYLDLEFSHKVAGQWGFHPILKWSSLDVWRYNIHHGLPIHEGYRIGLNRIGCAVCPMSKAGRADWLASKLAPERVDQFMQLTSDLLAEELKPGRTHADFLNKGDWKFRVNSKMLANPCNGYECHEREGGDFEIIVRNPTTDYRQWLKTVAVPFEYSIEPTEDGMIARIPGSAKREHRIAYHRIKNVFRKAANCVACGVCEANCPHGAIRFENRQPIIHGCRQCGNCHAVGEGCIRFASASTARHRKLV